MCITRLPHEARAIMPKNIKTKAWISDTRKPDYQPTDPPGFFYLFTGGYRVDQHGKPVKVPGDDEGPAGNVAFGEKTGSWQIQIKDGTRQKFRIVKWYLKSPNQLGLRFDPAPGEDVTPRKNLKIDVDNVPTGHTNEFEAFGVTLENDAGDRIDLDPRVYDIR